MMSSAPDVVGVTEVARLAGVSRQAVANWIQRKPAGLPPFTTIASGTIWHRRQMLAWLTDTGRLASKSCPTG